MTQKFYAGIGSRETPEHILKIMRYLGAHLYEAGWTLRSGGAKGADQEFEKGHDMARDHAQGLSQKEIYLPWRGYQNNLSMLHPGAEPFRQWEIDFAEQNHPAWHNCAPSARKMHSRTGRILLGLNHDPAKLVICWTKNGVTTGGTGHTIRMAKYLKIPVFNLGTAPNSAELERLVNEVERLQRSF